MLKDILRKIDRFCSLTRLIKLIAFLLIFFLIVSTQNYWGGWVATGKEIFKPFLIGFVFAYIMHPIVSFLERRGWRRNLAIVSLWGMVLFVFVLLFVVLLPLLYGKVSSLIVSMSDGVVWISEQIKSIGSFENFSLIDSLTKNIINLMESYGDWLPQLVSSLPNIMSGLVSIVTTIGFSIIISIYMLSDFYHIRHSIKEVFNWLLPNSSHYLYEIDHNVTVYFRSLIIIMTIKLFEYWAFYYLIGHPDWIVIGLLASLGTLVPYIGGTIANSIGIITALTLEPIRIVFLLIGIMLLSNVDAYVISPLVHEKRSAVGPLFTLFVLFAGGVVMGWVGIMMAMPVAIIVKTYFGIKKQEYLEKISEN